MKNVPEIVLQRPIFLCISWQQFDFFSYFIFLFLLFFSWCKIILWNASCQEKINPVVSNISCLSVWKPGTHRLFILVRFRKRTWIILVRPRIPLWRPSPKTSFFNSWDTWWSGVSGGQDAIMRQSCNPQQHISTRSFCCAWLKVS